MRSPVDPVLEERLDYLRGLGRLRRAVLRARCALGAHDFRPFGIFGIVGICYRCGLKRP